MKENDRAIIGIDLGGTKIAAGIFVSSGKLIHQESQQISGKHGQQVGDELINLIIKLQQISTNRLHRTSALGIAVPGIYHHDKGTVWAPNIPGWDNFPLRDMLTKHLPKDIRVVVDSDRACYILGETWKGAAKGCKNSIYLAVGTGIGAGILINGQVLRGAHDIAGAIGWLAVTHPYKPDYATYGCFEYHASGSGIARITEEILRRENNTLRGVEELQPDQITAREVFKSFELGDPIAKSVIETSIEFWGKASANLVSLFNPEIIIFGGGVFGPAVKFIDQIYAEAKKWAQPVSIEMAEFVPSQLEKDAGLHGAGFLALQQTENDDFAV